MISGKSSKAFSSSPKMINQTHDSEATVNNTKDSSTGNHGGSSGNDGGNTKNNS